MTKDEIKKQLELLREKYTKKCDDLIMSEAKKRCPKWADISVGDLIYCKSGWMEVRNVYAFLSDKPCLRWEGKWISRGKNKDVPVFCFERDIKKAKLFVDGKITVIE